MSDRRIIIHINVALTSEEAAYLDAAADGSPEAVGVVDQLKYDEAVDVIAAGVLARATGEDIALAEETLGEETAA
jgi:hypothetical protein